MASGIYFARNVEDASISSPADGQVLIYRSATGKWTNELGAVILPTGEPMGFPSMTDNEILFDTNTAAITVRGLAGGSFTVWVGGVAYTRTSDTTPIPAEAQLPGVESLCYAYYKVVDGVISLEVSLTAWDLTLHAPVATLYLTDTQYILGDERHGIVMDHATHRYLHETRRTAYASGFGLTLEAASFEVAAGVFYDEDIRHAIGTQTSAMVMRREGGFWQWAESSTILYHKVADVIQWNNSGTPAAVSPAGYVAYWLFATDSLSTPIWSLIGEYNDTTLANALANNTYESLHFYTLPFAEMKLLYRVIYKRSGTNATVEHITDYRSSGAVAGSTYVPNDHSSLSGLSDANAHPASAIGTVTTNFADRLSTSETTVQAALDKLDDHTHDVYTYTRYHLNARTSDVSPHQSMVNAPDPTGSTYYSASTNGATPVLLRSFISYPVSGLGLTYIPAGMWRIQLHVSTTDLETIEVYPEVYKRTAAGVETLLFETITMLNPSINVITQRTIDTHVAQQTILPTDRLVLKVYVFGSQNKATKLYINGLYPSWIQMPETVQFYNNEGNPTTVDADGGIDGSSTYPARRDHSHALAVYSSAPASVDATAASAGTSPYASRGDHRHQLGSHVHSAANITSGVLALSAAGSNIRVGDAALNNTVDQGVGANNTSSFSHNAILNPANVAQWIRTMASNAASVLLMNTSGELNFYTQSDVNDTIGSVISFVLRWKFTASGGLNLNHALNVMGVGHLAANTSTNTVNLTTNAAWGTSSYTRLRADNPVGIWQVNPTPKASWIVNTDANTGIGSAITLAEKFYIDKEGTMGASVPAGCRVQRSTQQTVNSATLTPLSFDTEIADTDGCWAVGDPTKLYAKRAGYYMIGGTMTMPAAGNLAAGRLGISVRKNGTDYVGAGEVHTVPGKNCTAAVTTGMIYMAVNDYVEIIAYHDQAAPINLIAGGGINQHVLTGWMARIN